MEIDPYRTPVIKNIKNRAKYIESRDSNDSRKSRTDIKNIRIKTFTKPKL